MPLVAGGTLETALGDHGAFSSALAARMLLQLGRLDDALLRALLEKLARFYDAAAREAKEVVERQAAGQLPVEGRRAVGR